MAIALKILGVLWTIITWIPDSVKKMIVSWVFRRWLDKEDPYKVVREVEKVLDPLKKKNLTKKERREALKKAADLIYGS